MFESNVPVDAVSCSYTVLWNSFKRLTSGYSAAEKAKLFHVTATRVYPPEALIAHGWTRPSHEQRSPSPIPRRAVTGGARRLW